MLERPVPYERSESGSEASRLLKPLKLLSLLERCEESVFSSVVPDPMGNPPKPGNIYWS